MDKNEIYKYFNTRSALITSAQNYVDSIFKKDGKVKIIVEDVENFGKGMVRIRTEIYENNGIGEEVLDGLVPIIISIETLSKY